MEYRQLGRTGLRVSTLALGTNTFGGKGIFAALGSTDIPAAKRLVRMCLDAGVNLIDTADEYSGGLAEVIVGQAVKDVRDRVLVATKVRTRTGDGPNDTGLSRHHILRACEASLRRLKSDHIDLYQLHAWDGQTPLEETLEALDTLVSSGKVGYVGACNLSAWHLMKALAVADRHGFERFASHHLHYSLHTRDAESELIPAALDQHVGILVWSPLAGGLLTGKYRRNVPPPPGSRHAGDWHEPPVRDWDALHDLVDVLVDVADGHGATAAQVALAWLRDRPGVTSLVLGARTEEQLAANLAGAQLQLHPHERARLDLLTAPPLLYPYWHQAKIAADRLGPADLSLLGPHLAARPE